MSVIQINYINIVMAYRQIPVYRVHWLKAKARRDRWREEQILVASEMEWTELFFRHRASRWKALATKPSAVALTDINVDGDPAHSEGSHMPSEHDIQHSHSPGHICYALKLESLWNRLAQQAAVQFNVAKLAQQHFARSRSSSSSSN
jgi:hypothetical protein